MKIADVVRSMASLGARRSAMGALPGEGVEMVECFNTLTAVDAAHIFLVAMYSLAGIATSTERNVVTESALKLIDLMDSHIESVVGEPSNPGHGAAVLELAEAMVSEVSEGVEHLMTVH